MAKTVKEVIEEIKSKDDTAINRFSKKNFNALLKAMVNDTEFSEKYAKVKGGELAGEEEVMVTKNFRKWIQKVIEKAGVDKNESSMVLESSFSIDDVDGLYDFFAAALYEYINSGCKFDLPSKKDFKGSIYLKKNPKASKIRSARNPQTGEDLGEFEYSNDEYKSLGVSSSCPDYLKSSRKVN